MKLFVMRLSAIADFTSENGRYLSKYEVDAQNGRGYIETTRDIDKAMKFENLEEIFEIWKKQSTVRPFRPDGKPNRPLTAYSMSPEMIND